MEEPVDIFPANQFISFDTIRESIPFVTETVLHVLYLRHNYQFLSQEEIDAEYLLLSRLKSKAEAEREAYSTMIENKSTDIIEVLDEQPNNTRLPDN